MRILLVTSLYPEGEKSKRTETSYAIHNFIKYWNESNEILVIRIKSFGLKKLFNLFIQTNEFKFEDVNIKKIPLMSIHFLNRKFVKLSVNCALKYLKGINFFPDVIISHCATSHLIAYRMNKTYFNVKHVCGIHKADISKVQKGESEYIQCFQQCDLLACRSDSMKRRLLDLFNNKIVEKKLYIANSGVKESFFEDIDEIKKKAISIDKKLSFVSVTSFIPRKKIDVVLKTLARLKQYEWNYTIIGDGRERGKLERIVDEFKLESRVLFTGYVEQEKVAEVLKNSNVFILISDRETFGLVYLEAMANGCLVIGAKNWGVDGIVQHGKNGFLCEAGNEIEFEDVLKKIFSFSRSEWKKFIDASYSTALQYKEKTVAKMYLDRIRKVVSETE